ncbi:MAG: UDP-N-acetylmuramate dehydrogenase [Actinomycetota bacterium]|nr:UDP-N-acetylmuramate dehydrogenase [Actinomycetota bacterium]MDQ2956513.1 UDP-N-acetylmuramate dehydrogenase [Actinomycetota bacterium]
MRVGGPAGRFETAASTEALLQLIRQADRSQTPVLVIGGGSNLVVGDAGFDGLVVRVASDRVAIEGELITVEAGVEWDEVIRLALDAGLAGLEPLSGIPGSTGGTPVQNVGAYGTVTSELLDSLTVYDRRRDQVSSWSPADCGFGPHRSSVFKRNDRYVILDVTFRLRRSGTANPVRYAALADRLGVQLGARPPAREVREAVLGLRRDRGMILDAGDHDTWSVGSFFVNPVVSSVPEQATGSPQFADPDGIKLSAAWLIEQAGFARGYGRDWGTGTVALSSKHTLAVTNRGGARTAEVMAFAAHIRDGVLAKFGVQLNPECDLVNCELG